MKIGTKSLLFGVHQFAIHPWYVHKAWRLLFGRRPRLYELAAIITHDWGYWGCADMDGFEGEMHPARMQQWWLRRFGAFGRQVSLEVSGHSGFYAKLKQIPFSRLYCADKLATALYPRRLYLLLAVLSGEIEEYMQAARAGRYGGRVKIAGHMSRSAWLLQTAAAMTTKAFDQLWRFD